MKYIVYKTTNQVNGYIYIGVHQTQNPEIFDGYLGCGVYANKSNTYNKAKTCFQQAVKEFGPKAFRRETIATFDIAEEAYLLEALIVNEEFLKRSDVYNMILGGVVNTTSGKQVYMYSSDTGKYIKGFKSCSLAADFVGCDSSTISHSIKFKFKVKNFCFSYEKSEILDLTEFDFKILQPVYRYLKTGEFDKAYDSLNSAGEDSINTSAVYIQKAAILGYLVKDTYYFSYFKEKSYDKARTKYIQNRPVYQYDEQGKFIKEYNSQKEAELANPYCNITNCVKLRSLDTNKHYWAITKLKEFNVPKKRIAKKVGKFNENGTLLQTWQSSNECAKEVGTAVKNVLRGEYQKHKGFIYKYINN